MEQRFSNDDVSKRDIPSFIEPRPPLIINPFMRPRPQKATNLLPMFEEDSELEEPDLVQVYLRMKPYNGPNNLYEVRSDKYLVTSVDTTTAGHGRRTQHNVSRLYPFTRIFEAKCSQKEIFDQVVKDNLKKLVEGQSFTLLTYGASGSGKTYTLMGSIQAPGLVPRSLEYVFKLVDAAQTPFYKPSDSGAELLGDNQREIELLWVKKLSQVSAPARDKYRRMSVQLHSDLTVSNIDLANRTKYYVWVSFVEIYNEAIYDLLVPPDKRIKLRMREDSSGQVYVKGATQAFVRSGLEAYDVMLAGKQNLVVAATGVHAHSSRSHSIFTITMLTETGGETRTSCVRLCDLAGCERANATQNTGARMQESRSINTSLHVLERCLHMLRSNQKNQRLEALVPYRESKLTRLLGSGLSGSRGEAVTMVMTLNPAPQYAQETKHVLSLAAVAKELQINNTAMYASTLESSAQDVTTNSTMWCSSEVQRLKTELERVHFELAQAESHNKKLQAIMEENQNTVADTMREMVEEAKDMTRQYYEFQLTALRNEMQESTEEYEARLAESENKLFEETQARSLLEAENNHLRACLCELDEKTGKGAETEQEIVVTDSEDDGNDHVNQSLEPSFQKECINISQAVTDNIHKADDNVVDESDESTDTTKQDTSKNSDYETGDESEAKNNTDLSITVDCKNDMSNTFNGKNDPEHNARESYTDLSHSEAKIAKEVDAKPFIRGTYFVQDFVNDSLQPINVVAAVDADANSSSDTRISDFVPKNVEAAVDADANSLGDPRISDFEPINKEAAVDADANSSSDTRISDFKQDNGPNKSIEIKKEVRGTYFVRKSEINMSDAEKVEGDEGTEVLEGYSPTETYFTRTSAIDTSIDEEMQEMVENKTTVNEIATKRQAEDILPPTKVSEILVSKILQSLKKSTNSNASNCSLKQFEQLEKASQESKYETVRQDFFGDIKMLKEKRNFFDASMLHVSVKPDETEMMISHNETKDAFRETLDNEKATTSVQSYKNMQEVKDIETYKTNEVESLITTPDLKKRTYFDNIEVTGTAPNKMVAEIISSVRKNHDRSPSIVSGDSEPIEPSTMKKLLGENIAKLEVLSSINKPAKKHESIDVFEGFESPQVKPKEIAPTPVKCNIEDVRESIDKLVLSQKMRNKQDIKLKSIVSVDKSEQQNILNVPKIIENLVDRPAELNETHKQNNTIEEFENIYKDLSTQRPTEFDLLATSQEIDANTKQSNISEDVFAKPESNKENTQNKANEPESGLKYNLRHRNKYVLDTSNEKVNTDNNLLVNSAKCASKKILRSLRLHRRKNEVENVDFEENLEIVNLKKEFSDITLGLPAMKKEVKDIPSPEKLPADENLPLTEIQSCPSKSVLRSRRKLFTPRAEPLEESSSQAGDSSERVRVPRPSYHRARTRRKL